MTVTKFKDLYKHSKISTTSDVYYAQECLDKGFIVYSAMEGMENGEDFVEEGVQPSPFTFEYYIIN